MTVQKKIALVTGANRGIGFEVCRQLARMSIHVILTSRDEAEGQAACQKLAAEGLDVVYHPRAKSPPWGAAIRLTSSRRWPSTP